MYRNKPKNDNNPKQQQLGLGWSLLTLCALFFMLLLVVAEPTAAQDGDGTANNNDYDLKEIHIITRHGARTPLPKHSFTLLEEQNGGGSALTPLGQRQMYDLGVWLRNRYSSIKPEWFDTYQPLTVRLESSALDRTITSSNTMALGLFPKSTRIPPGGYANAAEELPTIPVNIPVYSQEIRNDIIYRPYDKCPAFHDALEDLYQTEEWQVLEESSTDLLIKLANVLPDYAVPHPHAENTEYIPLRNIWNVYDTINVAKTECNTNPLAAACQALPDPDIRNAITTEEWNLLEPLAHEVELWKYGPDVAGNKLGSNLLWQIIDRIPSHTTHIYHYSAHYATMLGFLATLQLSPITNELPGYASALIVEIYHQTQDPNPPDIISSGAAQMRILYKSGPDTESVLHLPLTEACSGASTQDSFTEDSTSAEILGLCSVEEIVQWAGMNVLSTYKQWCDACQNTHVDVCKKDPLILSGGGIAGDKPGSVQDKPDIDISERNQREQQPSGSGSSKPKRSAPVFLGGILVGICLSFLITPARNCILSSNKSASQGLSNNPNHRPANLETRLPRATSSASVVTETPPPPTVDMDEAIKSSSYHRSRALSADMDEGLPESTINRSRSNSSDSVKIV